MAAETLPGFERGLPGPSRGTRIFLQHRLELLPVRRRIAERLTKTVMPEVWVIDDVSFPKCGQASAGMARQCCGALGKGANCQVAVSVHAATDTVSCPLNWQLYLPRKWTGEPDRCRRAGVPDDVVHGGLRHRPGKGRGTVQEPRAGGKLSPTYWRPTVCCGP
ncbi:transposase [Streptomyces sp. NPDC047868]|uniref:transposase n=1 Tax=Streptomyces sp. NPDC047868 TaxID=3155480 RepID=UPI0034545019